jgi:hypothetical protein
VRQASELRVAIVDERFAAGCAVVGTSITVWLLPRLNGWFGASEHFLNWGNGGQGGEIPDGNNESGARIFLCRFCLKSDRLNSHLADPHEFFTSHLDTFSLV